MESASGSSRGNAAALGTTALLVGFLLFGVVLTARLDADWGRLGSVIERNPVLCLGMALGFMVGGVLLLRHSSQAMPWSPTRSGRRFRTAILYTRRECPLCDEAAHTLSMYEAYLPPIDVTDIDGDRALRERFQTCVPVLELDGKVRFRGHINETLLRRLIEGTAPLADPAS